MILYPTYFCTNNEGFPLKEPHCQDTKERETDGGGDDGEVVDAEVGVVLLDLGCDVSYRFNFRKYGTVDEFRPRVALGVIGVEGFDDVVDRCAEGGGGSGDWDSPIEMVCGFEMGEFHKRISIRDGFMKEAWLIDVQRVFR
ncbi:hypothetical protein L6452_34916 [Arctium lappa]|uniref:Uncharacterized protein n=1 Tax=Arctium lappa TaxID=4217 RepID=A0ACB8YKM6_ARCLA|nr:hypothetical protein L6452_34916 [Arctium lappa]